MAAERRSRGLPPRVATGMGGSCGHAQARLAKFSTGSLIASMFSNRPASGRLRQRGGRLLPKSKEFIHKGVVIYILYGSIVSPRWTGWAVGSGTSYPAIETTSAVSTCQSIVQYYTRRGPSACLLHHIAEIRFQHGNRSGWPASCVRSLTWAPTDRVE